jgi:hypothetical protein
MNKKSNMNVRIAVIASRTRMKPSATKILSISVAIRGPVPRYLDIRQLSTPLPLIRAKLIPVGIAEKIFSGRASLLQNQMDTKLLLLQSRTGR